MDDPFQVLLKYQGPSMTLLRTDNTTDNKTLKKHELFM